MPQLRFATPRDIPSVLNLVRDLAVYEKAPLEVTLTEKEMIEDGFENNLFKCIVAEVNREIIGMALYYPRYSTWKGKTIHLEDFIVKEEHRGNGLGLKLFERVVEESQKFGAKRLEWMVLEWNQPALNFYEKVGAEIDPEWSIGKLREKEINSFKFTAQ